MDGEQEMDVPGSIAEADVAANGPSARDPKTTMRAEERMAKLQRDKRPQATGVGDC